MTGVGADHLDIEMSTENILAEITNLLSLRKDSTVSRTGAMQFEYQTCHNQLTVIN